MAEQIITKRCSKCKQIKPLSEFHKHRKAKDGYQCWCKNCSKQYQQTEPYKTRDLKRVKKYQQTEKGKAVIKRYQRSEKGKAILRKAVKKYRKTEKGKIAHKRFRTLKPNQRKATNAVNNAIAIGKLSRPDTLLCHYCPKPAQQYHHWHGYDPEHRLDVIPVCIPCHHNHPVLASFQL